MSTQDNQITIDSLEHVHFMCAVLFYLHSPKKWRGFFDRLDSKTLNAYHQRLGDLSETLESAVRTLQDDQPTFRQMALAIDDQPTFRQMALAISGFYEVEDAVFEIICKREDDLNEVRRFGEDNANE